MSELTTTGVAVAAYFRKSKDVQEKSIERQREEVLPYCTQKGYHLVAEYTDEGIRGNEVWRGCRQRLIADAEAGKFAGIILDHTDRLFRLDSLELGEFLSPLRRAGVWLESVAQGQQDYESMTGRVMLSLNGEMARGEQQEKGRRCLTGQLVRANRGKPPLPKRPYGFQ